MSASRPRNSAKKVLVVDDDPQVLALTTRLLRTAGYEIVTRSDAVGTTVAVAAEQPDIVLIDLNMPLISGERLTAHVRRALNTPPIIILHSGIGEAVLRERAASCGADGYIPKGLPVREFVERLSRIVQNARGTAAGARQTRPGIAE